MDKLIHLAIDTERRCQLIKAQVQYEHITSHDKEDKGLQSNINRVNNLSDTVDPGRLSVCGWDAVPGGWGCFKTDMRPLPNRHGATRSAMGVVYRRKDPKIGRVLVIKMLAPSHKFEGGALDDARQRVFHKTETTGRLHY